MPDNLSLYRQLYRIRRFEETVLDYFPKGVFKGTTHTYLGQEANAVAVLHWIKSTDLVVSNHRCHGHFLAYGGILYGLFAELMGKATGVCAGRGGSQHLHWRNFYSNGIQGGMIPIATGMALAEKRKRSGAVTIAFLGDGTLGEGVVYETLNMAALWKAPILYVVENNHIAQTTPIDMALAGTIAGRFQAFGIPTMELDSSDVLEILPVAGDLIEQIQQENTPKTLILHTYRFGPHSKGDDTRDSRELDRLRGERDPLKIHANRLNLNQQNAIEGEVEAEIEQALQQAIQDPYPTLSSY